MKTCDLKLGMVVRYKGNTGPYMDMTVVVRKEKDIVLHRPYI